MVRVSKTILVQSMYMLLPGALIYALMKPGQKTEAELAAELREKYGAQIRKQVGHREALNKRVRPRRPRSPRGRRATNISRVAGISPT
jgi:hypothetical protein